MRIDFSSVDIRDIDIDLVTQIYDRSSDAEGSVDSDEKLPEPIEVIAAERYDERNDRVARNLFGSSIDMVVEHPVHPYFDQSTRNKARRGGINSCKHATRCERFRTPSMDLSDELVGNFDNNEFDSENSWFYQAIGRHGVPIIQTCHDFIYMLSTKVYKGGKTMEPPLRKFPVEHENQGNTKCSNENDSTVR